MGVGGTVTFRLTVNGAERVVQDAWPGENLLYVLRERLGLPGAKNACEQGECGSCSVLLDSVLVCACLVAAAAAEGRDVVTVEGLTADASLTDVQQAFLDEGAVQCG
ncbi:MAG: aerobic carbon-monoxide dehydrogenase small subunit, partial [Actinomycetota bacterium]|nr:aerobic carbon-monoxide dehydrogenase small subunit [Actinomycetota bacterium]